MNTVPQFFETWVVAMVVLVIGCLVAFWAPGRRFAGVAPGLVCLLMLAHIARGHQRVFEGINQFAGLASIEGGLNQAAAAGPWFGLPLVVACVVIGGASVVEGRESRVRPSPYLAALTVSVTVACLLWISAFSVSLVVGTSALVALAWMLHAASQPPVYLFPIAVIGVWFAASGESLLSIFEALKAGGYVGTLRPDLWVVRLVVFALGLGFALSSRRKRALLAVPVVLAALCLGGTRNLVVGLTAPVEEGEERPPLNPW